MGRHFLDLSMDRFYGLNLRNSLHLTLWEEFWNVHLLTTGLVMLMWPCGVERTLTSSYWHFISSSCIYKCFWYQCSSMKHVRETEFRDFSMPRQTKNASGCVFSLLCSADSLCGDKVPLTASFGDREQPCLCSNHWLFSCFKILPSTVIQ